MADKRAPPLPAPPNPLGPRRSARIAGISGYTSQGGIRQEHNHGQQATASASSAASAADNTSVAKSSRSSPSLEDDTPSTSAAALAKDRNLAASAKRFRSRIAQEADLPRPLTLKQHNAMNRALSRPLRRGKRPEKLKELHPHERRRNDYQFLHGGHTLLTYGNVRAEISRTAVRSTTVFRSVDAQYQIKFNSVLQNRALSYEAVYFVLMEALTLAFEWLNESFGAATKRFVTLQLHDPTDLVHANEGHFNSGVFELSNAHGLVDQALGWAQNCFNSQHIVSLNDRLICYIQILDAEPPRGAVEPATEKWDPETLSYKPVQPLAGHDVFALVNIFGNRTDKNFFALPSDIPELENMCLPGSIVYAQLLAQKRRFDYLKKIGEMPPPECRRQRNLYNLITLAMGKKTVKAHEITRQKRRYKQALRAFVKEIKGFLSAGNFSFSGPYPIVELIEFGSVYYEAIIQLFSNVGNRLKMVSPPRDVIMENHMIYKRKMFYLYEEHSTDSPISHISVLRCPDAFFARTGYYCIKCNRNVVTAHSRSKHVCRIVNELKCSECFRIRVDPTSSEYYIDSATQNAMCIPDALHSSAFSEALVSKAPAQKNYQCRTCDVKSLSQKCLRLHEQRCRKRVQCPLCKRFIKIPSSKTRESVLAEHKCNEVMCRICYQTYDSVEDPDHICLIKEGRYQKYFKRHHYWDIETISEADSSINCLSCATKEAEYMREREMCMGRDDIRKYMQKQNNLNLIRCSAHIDEEIKAKGTDYLKPLMVVLYLESRERGTYSRICFCDDALELPEDAVLFDNVLKVDYLPEALKGVNVNRKRAEERKDKASRFGLKYIPKSDKKQRERWEKFTCLEDLKGRGMNCLTKMLLYVLRPEFADSVFLAHNSGSFDSQLLLQYMLLHGIKPRITATGRKLLNMEIRHLNINFADSRSYMPESLKLLCKRFDLPDEKYGFPINTLSQGTFFFHYKGVIPANDYYITFKDTKEEKDELIAHLDTLRAQHYQFDFNRELYHYNCLDTEILARACSLFIKQSFEMQEVLCLHCPPIVPEGRLPFIDPFTLHFTNASYCYNLYKIYGMPKNTLYTLMYEMGPLVNSSYEEMRVALYFEHAYPHCSVYSKFTSNRPKHFGKIVCDVYIEDKLTKEPVMVVEYHGCVPKGCLDENCDNMKGIIHDLNTPNYLKKTPKECEIERNRKDRILRQEYGIKHILHIWQCEWTRIMNMPMDAIENEKERELAPSVRDFLDITRERPYERLVARTAVRGGRSENFGVHVDIMHHPNYELKYTDFVSLYPSVAISELYPTGRMRVLIGAHDMARVECPTDENGYKFFFNENDTSRYELHGLIHCKICPPKDMFIPCLPLTIDGKSLVALCFKCASKQSNKPCTHNDDERSWTTVYTIPEVAYAMRYNYKLVEIYEFYSYSEAGAIFKKFFEILASFKIRFEGFPKDVKSEEDKLLYCETVNSQMEFVLEGVRLTPELIRENKALRSYVKLLLNSTLGKLCQRGVREEQNYMSSQEELNRFIYKSQSEIRGWTIISDNLLHLRTQKMVDYAPPNRTSCLVLGSYVTAYGRIKIHENMMSLYNAGAAILYTDTDSIIFAIPKNVDNPLKMANTFHAFKDELPGSTIKVFSCIGAKNYSLLATSSRILQSGEEEEEEEEIVHVRGISVNSRVAKEYVNATTMGTFAKAHLRGEKKSVATPQFHLRTVNQLRQVQSKIYTKSFGSPEKGKRSILLNSERDLIQTMPYGYTDDLLKYVQQKYNVGYNW